MDMTEFLGGGVLMSATKIKGTSLDGASLTIESVEVREFDDGGRKPVVWFDETEEGLTLNITNSNILVSDFGKESNGWVGKKIQLNVIKTKFGSDMRDSIQVKPLK